MTTSSVVVHRLEADPHSNSMFVTARNFSSYTAWGQVLEVKFKVAIHEPVKLGDVIEITLGGE